MNCWDRVNMVGYPNHDIAENGFCLNCHIFFACDDLGNPICEAILDEDGNPDWEATWALVEINDCTTETCMMLPDGKTCSDCVTFNQCLAFGSTTSKKENVCNFFPIRFLENR